MKAARAFSQLAGQAPPPARSGSLRRGVLRAFLALIRGRRRRALAEQALRYSLADLQIDWPVELVWEKGLCDLGQVHGSRRHQIKLRPDQDVEEGVRTTFHEVYHLAQFHKWKTLSPVPGKGSPADLGPAEALAELYSRVTFRELRRARERRRRGFLIFRLPWKGKLFPAPREAASGPAKMAAFVEWKRPGPEWRY